MMAVLLIGLINISVSSILERLKSGTNYKFQKGTELNNCVGLSIFPISYLSLFLLRYVHCTHVTFSPSALKIRWNSRKRRASSHHS